LEITKTVTANIGITATREGLTGPQLKTIVNRLDMLKSDNARIILHQGCCVGGDEQIAIAAHALRIPIIAYPPDNKRFFSKIAFELSFRVEPDMPYLARNDKIIEACNVLFVAPRTKFEEVRSGTWSTFRHARTFGRYVIVIYNDGGVDEYA
jgi:hypothetical protein